MHTGKLASFIPFTRQLVWGAVVTLGLVGRTFAAEPVANPSTSRESEASLLDRIWSRAELYNNPENAVVQSVAFTGRYQLDYAVLDHDDFDELNTRRWRMGGKAKLFNHFTLHSEVELHHDASPWYERLTDAYIAWSPSKALKLTLGKHSAPFTVDGMTSSKELLAIDRSNLANNLWFPQEYFPGVSGSGECERWQYHLGVYSSGSANKEFGEFDGGYFTVAAVGYDSAEPLHVKQALLTANYVYNEPDSDNSFTRSLQHVGSLNFQYDAGRWGFRCDVSAGKGYLGQSDLWGTMLMPYCNITGRFQAVARYTYLGSADPQGIRFARYESSVVSGRGDNYHEIYGGLNYYFYGHKLKVQTGVQYADMDDDTNSGGNYRGWSWVTGLRVSW